MSDVGSVMSGASERHGRGVARGLVLVAVRKGSATGRASLIHLGPDGLLRVAEGRAVEGLSPEAHARDGDACGLDAHLGGGGDVRGAADTTVARLADHGIGRRLGEEVRHGVVAHVGAAAASGDGKDGGAGAREVGPVRARLERDLDDRLEGEHVRAVLLVQLVLHRVAQRVELPGGEAVDEHAGARDVVDGVGVAQGLGQRLARLGRAHLLVRDEEHALCALGNADSLRDPLARGRLEGDLEAAVDGGGNVVGVALLVGRELQQQLLGRRSREVLATQRQPRRQPRDERRRARAHPTRGRHGVLALEVERRHLLP
mmetsp:Transcript_83305/g.202065  ORF Transcript_83305/g.202065 Transcript_83305/m.202065 type:complete len:316 (-) Transcript_83305:416-1363(-)